MKPTLFIASALIGSALGIARADDKGKTIRTTATVEVIDDARQVDDIIARVKAKEAESQAPRVPVVKSEAAKLERAPLPPARDHDDKVRDQPNRQRDHRDRDHSGNHHSHR